jgi:hypothetical protein
MKLSNDQALIAFKLASRINNTIGQNQKLGFAASWSLTSAVCPVKTEGCRFCYALRLEARPNVRKSWTENETIARRPDFDVILTAALGMLPPMLLRIHVDGDFFNDAYVRAWSAALMANRHIRPWSYTRAWMRPDLRRAIERAFSWDCTPGRRAPQWLLATWDRSCPPAPIGWRVALMDLDFTQSDLRHGHHRPLRRGEFICTYQTGKSANCSTCGLCGGVKLGGGGFEPIRNISNVIFPRH